MLPSSNATSDSLLALLGLLGFFAFFLLLPQHHPDSLADFTLSKDDASRIASEYLQANGYQTDNLTPRPVLSRWYSLLQDVQADLGRKTAVDVWSEGRIEQVPAYGWRVDFDEALEGERASPFTVYLTLTGIPYALTNHEHTPAFGADRAALTALLRAAETDADSADPVSAEALSSVPDSSFRLVFAPPDSTRIVSPEDIAAPVRNLLEGRPTGPVPREAAVAMARHHMAGTPLAAHGLTVHAIEPDEDRAPLMTSVTFHGEPVMRQKPVVEVLVAANGRLVAIDTDFEGVEVVPATGSARVVESTEDEDRGGRQGNVSVGLNSGSTVADVIEFLCYLVLIVGLLVTFFRRLGARVVDTRAVVKDAVLGGLGLGMMMVGSAYFGMMQSGVPMVQAVVLTGISTVVAALGGALLVFLLTGAADSMTREAWPKKLRVLSLVRLGQVRNHLVGRALLRGLALSGLLLGTIMLVLTLFPHASLVFGNGGFIYDFTFSTVMTLVGTSIFLTQITLVLLLLGVGTYVYRRRPSGAWVVGVIVLIGLFLMLKPQGMRPQGVEWVLLGSMATVLAVAYWRYEFVTCFVGLFFANVLWELRLGWLMTNSPVVFDFWVGVGLFAVVLVLGLEGIRSKKSGRELPDYTPPYIEEMAQQERLHRELEIARQVQLSFLPAKMPSVPGLDIAAVCDAAQEVGGDYYDFIELPDGRLGIAFGDVSGKGIQAAFFMTLAKGFLQSLGRDNLSPKGVLQRMNDLFCANVPRGTFVTMIYGVLDPVNRTFTFARAGHNPLILKRSPSQRPDLLLPAGLAVGMTSGKAFNETIEEATVPLRTGDALVFYTDGFSEAFNSQREEYGEDRLSDIVAAHGGLSARELLDHSLADVQAYMGTAPQHDDMTMVVVKFNGAATKPEAGAARAVVAQADVLA